MTAETAPFAGEPGRHGRLTIRSDVACRRRNLHTPEALLNAVALAVYVAKRTDHNRVEVATPDGTERLAGAT